MTAFDSARDAPWGLHSYRQLLEQGFSEHEIHSARSAGTLIRLHRGLYALGSEPASRLPLATLRILGVAARSPSMVVSHASAAVLHNIPLWRIDPAVVHLTKGPGGGSITTPSRVVHAGTVPSEQITQVRGVSVTSVAWTLGDLSRSHPFESAVIACDYGLHHELTTPSELAGVLARGSRRPGSTAARRAILFADGRAESPGESRTRVVIHRLGLAPPELQVDVIDRFGTPVGRTDLGYVNQSALIEFDGKIKYGKLLQPGQDPTDVVVREKAREDAIRAVGVSMLRIVWSELDRPEVLRHRIHELLRQGRSFRSVGATSGTLIPRAPIRVEGNDSA